MVWTLAAKWTRTLIANVISTFLWNTDTKIDVSKASSDLREQLESLVPTYESLAAASRVNFIQSLVSSLLVETIFQAYFVGLPEQQAEELRKTEKTLGSYGEESLNKVHEYQLADQFLKKI